MAATRHLQPCAASRSGVVYRTLSTIGLESLRLFHHHASTDRRRFLALPSRRDVGDGFVEDGLIGLGRLACSRDLEHELTSGEVAWIHQFLRMSGVAGTDEQSAVGLLLRTHRQRLDLTIESLSEASGISVRTISDIERGVSTGPHPRTIAALAGALALTAAERTEFAAAARAGRAGAVKTNPSLGARPHRVADFNGRADERALISTLLRHGTDSTGSPSAVVVSGPPGVGKTTLALEVLNDAAYDSTLFVDLQGFEVAPLTPLQILQALLRQVSGRNAEFLTMSDATEAWRNLPSEPATSVLLDNAASEAQVRPVLATDAPVHVVVTSRRTLAGLEGAQRVPLGPLERADSIALLRRSVRREQETTGDLDEIAGYCADLPLALRIAGARLASRPQWTVQDYANRLRWEEGRIRHLVAGDLNVESTFALSYNALDVESREFFRSLALLRGSTFSARMASVLQGMDPVQATSRLDELVDLGLVESLVGDRYRLHDLLRIFASDRLTQEEAPGLVSARRERLEDWILESAMCAARSYAGDANDTGAAGYRPAPAAREWLLAESSYWIDGIRGAALRARHTEVSLLVDALREFSDRETVGVDWWTLLELGTASARLAGDGRTLARLLCARSDWQLRTRGDAALARASAEEAVRVSEEIGDDREFACALIQLSAATGPRDDADGSPALANRGRDILHRLGEIDLEVDAVRLLVATSSATDPTAVLAQCRDLLALLDAETVRPITRVFALNAVARSLLKIEAWDDALRVAQRFVSEAGLFLDEPDFLARAYRHRGFAELGLGNRDRARDDLEAAVGIARTYAPSWWSAEIDQALEVLDSGWDEQGQDEIARRP